MNTRIKRSERENMKTKKKIKKGLIAIVTMLFIVLLSRTVGVKIASAPKTYSKAIEHLDRKKDDVMMAVAASSSVSTVISMIPDDTGTPVATKLADVSAFFLVVLCALFLEKYFLTVSGYVFFGWVIPGICILGIVSLFCKKRVKKIIYNIMIKVLFLGLVLYTVVPVSVKVSSLIEETHKNSITELLVKAENMQASFQEAENGNKEEKSFLNSIISGVTEFAEGVVDQFKITLEQAKRALGDFVEILAVYLVTTCIIPIVVLVVLVLIMKYIFQSINFGELLVGKEERNV